MVHTVGKLSKNADWYYLFEKKFLVIKKYDYIKNISVGHLNNIQIIFNNY